MIVEEGAAVLRSDGRYWRRKINRRIHRNRRLRLATKWGLLLSVNVLVIGLVGYGFAEIVRGVQDSPEFALRTVRVEGNHRLDEATVRSAVNTHLGRNLLSLDLDLVANDVAAIPWVQQVSVKRLLPGTLRIEVEEREPAAQAVVDGEVRVVDETGAVIGTSGPDLLFDLPVITGTDGIPEPSRMALRSRGVGILRVLRDEAPVWAAGVSEIDLSRPDAITVVSAPDDPPVLLDTDSPDRNVASWLALRRELGERLGTLDYVDLRWEGRIVAMPSRTVPR